MCYVHLMCFVLCVRWLFFRYIVTVTQQPVHRAQVKSNSKESNKRRSRRKKECKQRIFSTQFNIHGQWLFPVYSHSSHQMERARDDGRSAKWVSSETTATNMQVTSAADFRKREKEKTTTKTIAFGYNSHWGPWSQPNQQRIIRVYMLQNLDIR